MRNIDEYAVNREAAAAICGVTDARLKQWLDRGNIFPEKRLGRGYHSSFALRDLFKIAAVRALVDGTFSVKEACDALRSYGIYGTFLHDPGGVFPLSRNHEGRWVGMSGDGIPLTITINTYALFQDIWPRLTAHIRADSSIDQGDAERAISKMEAFFAEISEEDYQRRVAKIAAAEGRTDKG